MHTRLGPGRGRVFEQVKAWSGFVVEEDTVTQWRQVALKSLPTMWIITVLGSHFQQDIIGVIRLEGETAVRQTFELEKSNLRMLDDGGEYIQESEGEIYRCGYRSYLSQLFDLTSCSVARGLEGSLERISRFPEFCIHTQYVDVIHGDQRDELFLGLSKPGKLYASRVKFNSVILAPNVTSFTVASGFVIYTTTSHDAVFAPLSTVGELVGGGGVTMGAIEEAAKDWPQRKVERGSRIITAVPSTMSLVLQMPRGNLETINPRPMVMEVVKQDLDA